MKRSVLPLLALLLATATGRAAPIAGDGAEAPFVPATPAIEVVGSGVGPELACIGCAATGLMILMGGPPAWLKASIVPGSALALAGCVATCSAALKD